MQLTVNGEQQSFEDGITITELLREMELGGKRIAVERNGEIIPRSEHAETRLEDGDRLEIVHAVGGG